MKSLTIRIDGVPAPQGSKRHVGGGRMIEMSKKVGPWRAAVSKAVALQSFDVFTGPVEVKVWFYLPKGKTVKRLLPTTPPDVDKLLRGLFDALTQAGVWSDDALVVSGTYEKAYADHDGPGAVVVIRELVGD